MRDIIENISSFDLDVKEKVLSLISDEKSKVLRSDVVNNSNFRDDNLTFYFLKDLRLTDFYRLAIASWYVPEEVGIILRLDLEEKAKNLCPEDRLIVSLLIESKAQMLAFLQDTKKWHSRDFFGNILGKQFNLDRFFRVSPLRRKIVRPQRKRGYHDQGSRVLDHCWREKFDFSFTEEQNEIEIQRQIIEDTTDFIRGWLS